MSKSIAEREADKFAHLHPGTVEAIEAAIDRALAAERRRIAKALREEAVIVVHVAAMYRTEGLTLEMALAAVRAPRRGR